MKHEKEFTEAAEAWVEKLVPTKRVVWMRPTRASPMCRYTITPKAQRVVSECGVWLTAVVRGAMREDVVERDRCPLCATGRRAAGVEERRK